MFLLHAHAAHNGHNTNHGNESPSLSRNATLYSAAWRLRCRRSWSVAQGARMLANNDHTACTYKTVSAPPP